MLLTRRQPFYPSAAHDKFFSICTAFSGYTEFGIAPLNSRNISGNAQQFQTTMNGTGIIATIQCDILHWDPILNLPF